MTSDSIPYHAALSTWWVAVRIEYRDFNGADTAIDGAYSGEWREIEQVLGAMPLHLKASDQEGKQGRAIFDPVGTNEHIAQALTAAPHGWAAKIPILAQFAFLGTDVDFGKNGVVVEVQFSNYPFLLNNTIRSELFRRKG